MPDKSFPILGEQQLHRRLAVALHSLEAARWSTRRYSSSAWRSSSPAASDS